MTQISDKFLQTSIHDEQALLAALKSGQLSGTADIVATYEDKLKAAFSAKHAIAVSSGSAALQTALYVVGPGLEVLVPATAPLPSLLPITAAGARPVAVDVRPDSLDFDPEDLRRKIGQKTRAALIVPLWGYPIDLTETLAILKARNIPLIEDAAHAHGAWWRGRALGTLGKAGCFSTHDRKLLATGEGGFILVKDAIWEEQARSYSRLGNLQGAAPGMNFKINALAAALGVARLPHLVAQVRSRTIIANEIKTRIAGFPWVTELSFPADGTPNYYNLVLLLKGIAPVDARAIINRVHEAGIPLDQVKYGYDLFYRRPYYRRRAASCPNAEALISRVIQLPVHPRIGKTEIDRMVEIIEGIGDEL